MKTRAFAVIDLADMGAVGLMGQVGLRPTSRSTDGAAHGRIEWLIRERSIAAPGNALTHIYPGLSDGTGRVLRTNLGLAAPLLDRRWVCPGLLPGEKASIDEHDILLGQAIGQLGAQLTRDRRPLIAVVAADNPYITPAERIIQQARRDYRAEVTLVPWSVAAAQCWREHCLPARAADISRKFTVACVLLRHGRVLALPAHLVFDEAQQQLVPLRDYETDVAADLEAGTDSVDSIIEWLGTRDDWAGAAIVCSDPDQGSRAMARLATRRGRQHVGHVRIDHNTLAHGAGSLFASSLMGRVPYYASAPRVELSGAAPSITVSNLGLPTSLLRLSYWFDCLSGAATSVAGHRVFPAHLKVHWMSDGKDIKGDATVVECGRPLPFQVRLHGEEIRSMHVEIDGARGDRLPCRFGCSYLVGSGRPTVYVVVESLSRRFVLEWDRLDLTEEPLRVDLAHLHSDDDVRREFACRTYYQTWYNRYHKTAGQPFGVDPGPPPGAPPDGFHLWRRKFTEGRPNPCRCRWCES